MDSTTSNKIKAYGLRKDGTKTIIGLLSESHGYSRKFEVLYRLSFRILKSEQKFTNGLNELESFGFIKRITTSSDVKRIKLDKRIWDRNPDIIKLEHKLIRNRLNQNGIWVKPKTLIRDIRNSIEEKVRTKPSYYAVETHLNILLTQNLHDENEKGLIRLAKFRTIEESSNSKNNTTLSLFEFTSKNNDQAKIPTDQENPLIETEDEIDLQQDGDIFETNNSEEDFEELYDTDKDISGKDIDEDIFGASSDSDKIENPKSPEINKGEMTPSYFGTSDYLKTIVKTFSDKKGFSISESFNEISIKVNGIKTDISYDPFREELVAISRHKLKNIEIIEALKMYGKSYMIGQLAIDTVKGVDLLQLSKRFFITKYDISEIISMIEKIIYEAIQLERMKDN